MILKYFLTILIGVCNTSLIQANDTNDGHNYYQNMVEIIIHFHPKSNISKNEFHKFKLEILQKISNKTSTNLIYKKENVASILVDLEFTETIFPYAKLIKEIEGNKNIDYAHENFRVTIDD